MNAFLYFWFDTTPATNFPYAGYAFAFIIIAFVGSFALEYFRRKYISDSALKKALKPAPSTLWWTAITAIIMTWARLEGVSYVSVRFLWILLALFIVWRLFYIWKNHASILRKKMRFADSVSAQESMKKYLPKKKK